MPVQWWAKSPLEAIEKASFNAPQLMMDARTAALNQQKIPLELQAATLANQRFGAMTPLEVQKASLANTTTEMGLPVQALNARLGADMAQMQLSRLEGTNPVQPGSTPWWKEKPATQFQNTGKTGPAVPLDESTQVGSAAWTLGGAPRGNVNQAPLEGSYTDKDYQSLDQANRKWLTQGAQTLGLKDGNGDPITERSSPSAVRQAVRAYQASLAQAKRPVMPFGDVSKMGEYMTADQAFQNSLPTIHQGAVADLIKAGQGNQGSALGQTQGKQSIQAWQSADNARQIAAKTLGLAPDNLGPAGDPAATKKGQDLVARGASYHALKVQVEDIAENLPSLLDPRNKGALDQQMASVTRLVNKMAGASGTEGAMEMSLMEAGIPRSLIDANGVGEAVKIWYTQNPTLRASALRELPDILYKNTMAPDYEALGGNSTAWKRKLDGASGANLPTISTKEAYDALPAGAKYLDAKGRSHTKGGR